jgi:hypothetical protein
MSNSHGKLVAVKTNTNASLRASPSICTVREETRNKSLLIARAEPATLVNKATVRQGVVGDGAGALCDHSTTS